MKSFFQGVLAGMKYFGHNISILINTVLLFTVYILGVGLTAIVARIVGKKFLDSSVDDRASYWSELNLHKKDVDEYYRQF